MPYELIALTGFGVIILAVTWLPLLLGRLPLSLPMVATALGAVCAALLGASDFPFTHKQLAEKLTEYVLVIAVMGAGLKIDRPFGWRRWASTWRLLGIAMPLSIIAIALLGHALLGLPVAVAVLLGGILSPTDPVLAASVQVGPPGSGAENEVRFSLTAEAGLNDGLAFPFVNLGLLMLARGTAPDAWLGQWLLIDVAWKLPAAALIGFLLGWGLVHLSRQLPKSYQLPRSRDGLTSVGLTLIAYGLAEMAHTYGFVAVFVTAATLRNTGHEVDYARRLHDFAEQTERLASFLVLALFGAALVGGLLGPLSWADAVFAALTLFVVRPLATLVGFLGSRQPLLPQLAMGYFGIRGLGSLYYAIYVTNKAGVPDTQHLWAVVALVVLVSIVVYGLSANPVMRRLDEQCRLRSPSPARERAPNLG